MYINNNITLLTNSIVFELTVPDIVIKLLLLLLFCNLFIFICQLPFTNLSTTYQKEKKKKKKKRKLQFTKHYPK